MTTTPATLATSLGFSVPRHYLVAVFSDPAAARSALAALHDAGFPETATAISSGSDFLVSWQDAAGHQGFLSRLAALYPSEEHEALQDYLAEASGGASLVAIHLDDREEVLRARDVLKPFGAFDMRYFGNFTITDVSPDRYETP